MITTAGNTVFFAPIAAGTIGRNEIVPPTPGKSIVVLHYTMVSKGTVNVEFQSGDRTLTGDMYLVVNSGASASSTNGLFATTVGQALKLQLDANVYVGGHLTYILE